MAERHRRAQPDNGTHPTADTTVVKFNQRRAWAGESTYNAGRYGLIST
jgi:hypothetical protein